MLLEIVLEKFAENNERRVYGTLGCGVSKKSTIYKWKTINIDV